MSSPITLDALPRKLVAPLSLFPSKEYPFPNHPSCHIIITFTTLPNRYLRLYSLGEVERATGSTHSGYCLLTRRRRLHAIYESERHQGKAHHHSASPKCNPNQVFRHQKRYIRPYPEGESHGKHPIFHLTGEGCP